MPTTREAPIAPIKLKLGEANKSINIKTQILSASMKSVIPIKGDSKMIGRPVSSQ